MLKDTKDSDPKQAEWGKTWIQVLEDLAAYIKDVHTTGALVQAISANSSPFFYAIDCQLPLFTLTLLFFFASFLPLTHAS